MFGEHWTVFWDMFAVMGFGVLGATYTQRLGVFNVAIEGQILLASLVLAASLARGQEPLVAVVLAMVAAATVGAVVAFGVIVLRADEVVLGLGLNALIFGGSLVICEGLFGETDISLLRVEGIEMIRKTLSLVLGVLILGSMLLLRYSRFRFWLNAIEEDWGFAENADVPLKWSISIGSIISGVLAGLAGCYLAVSLSGFGRTHWKLGLGFVALGLVVASRGRLLTGMVGAAAFSAAYLVRVDQSHSSLSALYEFLPYVVVLGWFVGVGLARERNWISQYITRAI